MDSCFEWITKNQVFSGSVAAILTLLGGWLLYRRKKRENLSVSQKISSGNNSTNIQVGGDVDNLKVNKDEDGKED